MARIDVIALNKSFGHHPILRDLSLSIAEGEFVALVGPSGCGKSTLLRIIAGLEPVTSGTIAFDGQSTEGRPPQARNIAMVFQSYALYPHMRVRDNLAFGLRQRRLPAAEIAQRIEKAARILALEPYLDRYPRQLSGGQRQRVAMGRAIVREPVAFLLDEPLSNLDAQLRVAMRAEIRALQRELGVTTLYVTHDQIEAMTMADRIVIMNAGEVMQVDTPLGLYERPANRFVAGFIGSPAMNFVDASREEGGLRAADGSFLPLPREQAAGAPHELVLGLRPEHLTVRPAAEPDGRALEGTVRQVEQLGAETEIYVDGCGTRLCIRQFGGTSPPVGARVRLAYEPRHVHLFDQTTGIRIP